MSATGHSKGHMVDSVGKSLVMYASVTVEKLAYCF